MYGLYLLLLWPLWLAKTQDDCTDVAPSNDYTCEQQAAFGKCEANWMLAGDFCNKTCKRCSNAPLACAYYSTNGVDQLAEDEGTEVLAPSGASFIQTETTQECALACEVQSSRCLDICCNSFAYNTQSTRCYLKFGGTRFRSQPVVSGWQTFWRVGYGAFKTDESLDRTSVSGSVTACEKDLKINGYANAYVSLGMGRIAVGNGVNAQTESSGVPIKVNTVNECALLCEEAQNCDAITLNLRQGNCYLETGVRQFETQQVDGTWTTYWKIPEDSVGQGCTEEGRYCLYCGGNLQNECRSY